MSTPVPIFKIHGGGGGGLAGEKMYLIEGGLLINSVCGYIRALADRYTQGLQCSPNLTWKLSRLDAPKWLFAAQSIRQYE